jgi:hypothetical protein
MNCKVEKLDYVRETTAPRKASSATGKRPRERNMYVARTGENRFKNKEHVVHV